MTQKTSHQHTIPKCYLKAFANNQKKLFKKQKSANQSLEEITKDLVEPISLKHATVVDDFYSIKTGNDSMVVETKIYANQIENKYNSIYQLLTNSEIETFCMEQRIWILTCLLSMHCRTPKQFNLFEKEIPKVHKYEEEEVMEDYKAAHLKEVLPSIIQAHEFKRVHIYKITDGSEFITSDNPVLIVNPELELVNNIYKEQFNSSNSIIIPLNPKHCCVLLPVKDINGESMDDKLFYNKIHRENIDVSKTQSINFMMLKSADTCYYGTEGYMKSFFSIFR